jgi:hypothetical protein
MGGGKPPLVQITNSHWMVESCMRLALMLKPASVEARKNGCTCIDQTHIDTKCPVHFPLRYLSLLESAGDEFTLMRFKTWFQEVILIIILMVIIYKMA